MRIVMTGATSFVGSAAARAALCRGHEVTAVVRPGTARLGALTQGNERALTGGRLIVVENDLSSPELLPEKISGERDVFCHFGWGGSGSGSRTAADLQRRNLDDSLGAASAAARLGCRKFMFSGSQAEYGMHREITDENARCRPRSVYGEAKLEMRTRGEALCQSLGMEYIHLRIFSTYGPGDHPWTLVESCISSFLRGENIALGACAQMWNYLYIDDLAAAVCALCETPSGAASPPGNPVFNLAGAETLVLREFVEKIYEACGRLGGFTYGARQENAEGAINLIPDIAKLRGMGWEPEIDFFEGIRRTVAARKKAPDKFFR